MVSGRDVQSVHSVAKRSPVPYPIHVTPQLSTIEEGNVEVPEGADDAPPGDTDAEAGGGTNAEELHQVAAPRTPLPEDVKQAEAFQVSSFLGIHLGGPCWARKKKGYTCRHQFNESQAQYQAAQLGKQTCCRACVIALPASCNW